MRWFALTHSRRKRLITVFFLFITLSLTAQVRQVSDFFKDVSQAYSGIEDYRARISIKSAGQPDQSGTMLVKGSRVRINMNSGQVISINEGKLVVYVADARIVLEQEMTGVNAGSVEGLTMLQKYYKYSYSDPSGYKLVQLEDKSREKVVKLNFDAKQAGLEYRNMVISFTKELLIRRIVGKTFSGSEIIFDFTNIKINEGIPDNQFIYDAPGDAHTVQDFIYTPE